MNNLNDNNSVEKPQADKKKNKNIILAQHAGFCYGVKRAVETTKDLKLKNPDKSISVLGELIHNSQVISELESLGIKTIKDVSECEPQNGVCIIRSHGISPKTFNEIEKTGCEIADLTCPDVKKVQKKAIELAKDDFLVIIIGKPEHPEVVAITANAQLYSEAVYVTQDVSALKKIEDTIKSHPKVGVVVQTTQRIEILKDIVNYLIPITKELKIFNTICASTSLRQKEAKELAENSDLMVVVGSKKSANTTHLAEILKNITTTVHIEDYGELDLYKEAIEHAQNIGITAGASTPEYIIKKVISKLSTY